MGVKGLQYFMERCCSDVCVSVNIREMARQHAAKTKQSFTTPATNTSPTLVVDGMACLRHWYSCKDWVCGGQWREYTEVLKSWVEAFTSAGIRLVFFFDGVVEEQKRKEWVKRRRRVNGEIAKVFNYLKAHGEQPGRELFCLPSGVASFTRFALRQLGQEVFCSVQEADYEIARYASQHKSMGILGQDSDFIIYDSASYLSVEKLRLDNLTTVLYDQQKLCQTVGLTVSQLPLLACLLGNDVVSEEKMKHLRNNAISAYRINSPASHTGAPQGEKVLALSHLVSSLWNREEEEVGLVLNSLNLSPPLRELLQKGISSYILPGQEALQQGNFSALSSAPAFEKYVSPEILKASREKHVAAESFMVYGVLCEGIIECSNTLEDEEDTDLLPQAMVYKPCRQRTYWLLLHETDSCSADPPIIKEWFVYSGNSMQEPDLVRPVPVSLPGDYPGLDLLWFGSGSEVSALRLTSFFLIFDCQEFSELYGVIDDSLLGALCLITYITLQVQTLSEEDVDAYLSQAVCLRVKSTQELQHIKLPILCSRAVQLGSLFIRGLGHLLGANCASGCPLPNAALMPWQCFDGRLFHSKYLLAHNTAEKIVLLESDSSLSLFLCLREKLTEACMKRSRVLQSRPRPPEQHHKTTQGPRYREGHTGGAESWRERGGMARVRQHRGGWRERGDTTGSGQHGGGWRERGDTTGSGQHGGGWRERGDTTGSGQHGGGWRERGETTRERSGYGNWERGGPRGGGGEIRGPRNFPPDRHSYPNFQDEGPYNMSQYPKQSRGGSHGGRGRYRMAPRWSQPPASGT